MIHINNPNDLSQGGATRFNGIKALRCFYAKHHFWSSYSQFV
jgi:hypothetical protein